MWSALLRISGFFLFHFSVRRELMSHDEVEFNANGTVSTIPRHPLIWDEERSMGHHEDDIFMLPNIALLVSNQRKFYPLSFF